MLQPTESCGKGGIQTADNTFYSPIGRICGKCGLVLQTNHTNFIALPITKHCLMNSWCFPEWTHKDCVLLTCSKMVKKAKLLYLVLGIIIL